MELKIGDSVIFPKENYFTLSSHTSFTRNKEYIILDYESINGVIRYYTIKNDNGLEFNINKSYVKPSPSYIRNKIIDEILL